MNIFPLVVAFLVSAAVVGVAVVMYRGEVASRRAQSLAARTFIASRRPVEGWPAVWAWSPVSSRRGTEPVLPEVQGPSPRGTDAPSGVSVEGVAPVVVGGAS